MERRAKSHTDTPICGAIERHRCVALLGHQDQYRSCVETGTLIESISNKMQRKESSHIHKRNIEIERKDSIAILF